MPQVELIYHTGQGMRDHSGVQGGYAARLLAFTKNTRLSMSPAGFGVWLAAPWEDIQKELDYMVNTIPSSWEFCDLTFLITDLSRATAQQVTRSRNASFAMQSQRVTDMSEVDWDHRDGQFDNYMEEAIHHYAVMVQSGMSLEDARDLLPIGVFTNGVAKYNLRALVELVQKRTSMRVQGPYASIVDQMRLTCIDAMPWTEPFFTPRQSRAIALIEEVAAQLKEQGAVYKGPAGQLAKAADLLKA